MTYEEIKNDIASIAITLTSIVTASKHDYTHQSSQEEIIKRIDDTIIELSCLKDEILTKEKEYDT
jgi:hypothetical protein